MRTPHQRKMIYRVMLYRLIARAPPRVIMSHRENDPLDRRQVNHDLLSLHINTFGFS
jgi:hypothetical protein